MLLDDKIDRLLRDLIEQWNIAEVRIKKAEFVQGGEVVSSAVFELRYAGRKLVDSHHIINSRDWKNDPEAHDLICRYLADAIEDCVKAKHDAIDAMVDFVTIWFKEHEERIGLKNIVRLFPEYLEATGRIARIQSKIAKSREDRITSRDGVYNEIEETDYQTLIDLYEKMYLSQGRVDEIIRSDSRKKTLKFWLLFIPAAGAIILILFEIYKMIFHH